MSDERFRNAVEAALFAAGRPLSVDDILAVFIDSDWRPERRDVGAVLAETAELWAGRGLELVEVAGGWRFQVRREYSAHLGRLWSEKPPRYSRALMETLAIVAYRQPVTRGEIEEVRGVAVSPSILKTLQERDWIRVLGHKEIPGRPELLGTTRQFLDDFSLSSLEGLPPLTEIRDLDSLPDDLFPETRQGGVPGVQPQPVEPPPDAGEDGSRPASPVATHADAEHASTGSVAGEGDAGESATVETGAPADDRRITAQSADLDAAAPSAGDDVPATANAVDAGDGRDVDDGANPAPDADGSAGPPAADVEPAQASESTSAGETGHDDHGGEAACGGDDDSSKQTPG